MLHISLYMTCRPVKRVSRIARKPYGIKIAISMDLFTILPHPLWPSFPMTHVTCENISYYSVRVHCTYARTSALNLPSESFYALPYLGPSVRHVLKKLRATCTDAVTFLSVRTVGSTEWATELKFCTAQHAVQGEAYGRGRGLH